MAFHVRYGARKALAKAILPLCIVALIGNSAAMAADRPPVIGSLYWVGGDQLSRAAPDGSHYQVLQSGLDNPDGLVVDLHGDRVYWTNMSLGGPGGSLQRARLNGAMEEKHLVAPGQFKVGKEIELDAAAGTLYWADRDGRQIMRARADGSGLEPVLRSFRDASGQRRALENPVGIALDPAAGHIYITDRFMGAVLRFNRDIPPGDSAEGRGDVEVLVAARSGEERPIDIDLDLGRGMMYWTDRGLHQILRARLDGSGREVLVDAGKVAIRDPIGISLDLARGKLYWSDMSTHMIHRANLDGTQIETVIGGEKLLNGLSYGPLGLQHRALAPEAGPAAGGDTVVVTGFNFVPGRTRVRLGRETVSADVADANRLSFVAPPGAPGPARLSVITPAGEASLENAYHYR